MSARVEHIGSATLYLGDCRELLPGIGHVDALVADPPFDIVALGAGICGRRQYLSDIAGHIDGGFDVLLLAPFRNWLVFCGKSQIAGLISTAEHNGLRWQLLTWNKTNPTPLTNGNYLPDAEYMIHAFEWHVWDGKSRWVIGPVEKNSFPHPTVKPLYVMMKAVSSTSAFGDIVLDPFAGSGTTGVACARLGLRFIGIERHPPYFDLMCRRIEAAQRQADLFVSLPPVEDPADVRMADLFAEPVAP
jgi:hypothetical protein